jgi:hypothetical protein
MVVNLIVPVDDISKEFQALLDFAQRMTTNLGPDIESMLREGLEHPLSTQEVESLLRRVIERVRASTVPSGSGSEVEDAEELLALAVTAHNRLVTRSGEFTARMVKVKTVNLLPEYNGVRSGIVIPTPVFHEKEVPMEGGFIKTRDIRLWGDNERLEIHVRQFKAKYSRSPSPEELFHIMAGKMPLEGVKPGDEFEILALARSIAANGVRKPPIIDIDGTLLDGNRRIAACTLILNSSSDEFTAEDKKRAEYVYVWQLTPYATDDDREKVIVSLNFESDFKKQWPEYVRARKIYQEWLAMLELEPQKPGARRQADMKRELSRKYALGSDTTIVNRYLKMVSWANDFEDHHINERTRDAYTVKHAANRYFQYFDELSKGEKPGGVAWCLSQDDHLKQIVFDLLFEGKFENWQQVRALKHIYDNDEARDILARAHREPDIETAQTQIDDAVTVANTKRATHRSLGANTRIETFVTWLEEVPPRTLRDEVKPKNLERLLQALELVAPLVNKVLQGQDEEG